MKIGQGIDNYRKNASDNIYLAEKGFVTSFRALMFLIITSIKMDYT